VSLHLPPILTPPPLPASAPSSARVVSAILQVVVAGHVGILVGIVGPVVIGHTFGGNKPFDDFRIPGAILGLAVLLLAGGVFALVKRIWFVGGLVAGTAVGLCCIGLLVLFYTIVQTA
jgi:hypothetical protein